MSSTEYHAIDEDEYLKLLEDIFSYTPKHVILYTTIHEVPIPEQPEMFHRNVLKYLKKYENYDVKIVKNKYPKRTSAIFIILKRH